MRNVDANRSHVVIVGGGYAGVLAAVRLAGKTRGRGLRITLIDGRDHFVERIRLHQVAADQQVRQRPLSQLLAKTGVDFRQGWVTAIRPDQKAVEIHRNGKTEVIDYDYLICAMGSTVDVESVPGVAEHAHSLGGEEAAARLRSAVSEVAARGGRLLVVGGGLTGIEAASEMAEQYPSLEVTLATRGVFGETLSERGAAYVRQVFAALQIEIVERTTVTRLERGEAHCQDGKTLPFDLCLWAGSFVAPPLARTSGLPTNSRGQIRVDESLRSVADSTIYAIGDAAATPLRMACATAMPMAAYVADHLADAVRGQTEIDPFRFAYTLRCVSLGRRRGLVQFVDGDDTPRERILTGRVAALIKETICRFTVWSIRLEQWMPGSYAWAKAELPWQRRRQHLAQEVALSNVQE